MLNEVTISRAIIERYTRKLTDCLDVDVAIVGGGPSGLVAGYYLAGAGKRVALFERKLTIGGGIWGGGMMMNEVVVQDAAMPVLEELGLAPEPYEPGYYTLDAVDLASTLVHKAVRAGVKVFNLVAMEDVVIKNNRVAGLVINWGAIQTLQWHVDPLTIHSRFVLDGTGHPASVVEVLVRKTGLRLNTESGGVLGERPMEADRGEAQTVEYTREVYPGLFASGMAATAVHGGYRMGPVFGGMLLSGKKAAEAMIEALP